MSRYQVTALRRERLTYIVEADTMANAELRIQDELGKPKEQQVQPMETYVEDAFVQGVLAESKEDHL